MDEIESMRTATSKRLKELEEIYMSKKENSLVGPAIRQRMGFKDSTAMEQPKRRLS